MTGGLAEFFASPSNRELVAGSILEHLYLSLIPLLAGLVIALPLGRLAHQVSWLRGTLQGTANIVYTVPSLALFVIIPAVVGTPLLSPINVIIALSLYTGALLLRPVVDALESVPTHVTAAATAMGYPPTRRFLAVELPLSIPVLTASVRVASVSNISLVSVGALVGVGGVGYLFTDGFQRDYIAEIVVGILSTVLLALVIDLLLVLIARALTPWQRVGKAVRPS